MALITCPECGRKNVSDTATSCPNCGFNIWRYYNQRESDRISKKREELYDSEAYKNLERQINKKQEELNDIDKDYKKRHKVEGMTHYGSIIPAIVMGIAVSILIGKAIGGIGGFITGSIVLVFTIIFFFEWFDSMFDKYIKNRNKMLLQECMDRKKPILEEKERLERKLNEMHNEFVK